MRTVVYIAVAATVMLVIERAFGHPIDFVSYTFGCLCAAGSTWVRP